MLRWSRRRTPLGTEADRATFRTLHNASLAAPALREGLRADSAGRAVRHLRALLGTPAVALTDATGVLAWDGVGDHHAEDVAALGLRAVGTGVTMLHELRCDVPGCLLRTGIASPLAVEDEVVGTLVVLAPRTTGRLARAADEVATWVSGQLELAELDASRNRLVEAEVRALRAQISPHFIYNSLGAIASFVRTDPDRARELLLEFADFTRYSFRRHGEFTTLAEELRAIERYLLLEEARFGDRLAVRLRIAPEVLGVTVPFLCLQPLVENAVRHGLAGSPRPVTTISIVARDLDRVCEIEIEDDGAGEDPERIARILAGETPAPASGAAGGTREGGEGPHPSVGLGNVDARLRATYGDEAGLEVETAPRAGTRVTVRIPKFAPGVHV
ncbi:histidine kinase [Nocardioides zeae]|uniref:Histidine kinase n=1 Tax=Nocardioides imazamoxiresistens TaxID=3231893 RepID=A0ABU3Q028_9ACTN|nr:histidine kinase [Nocardioides zeae]MDT9594749.1 histidine kinase [Nocardioides zeae]